ncbi:translation initiation factor IF-2 [Pelagicoccus sp. SDUM812002]|uniref:translation initiation factor IF-2 n=1 Tax=Pelagicoccus sp. SDUM812002 TaxID=3041266 RepID=UPI00280CD648|nr:translation initiation factor IF-2 [Pelagicoccus sp. SDUM812002]MDQ8184163.1 translation initiation factor IF-2 [Pelagicoccus sp. SDUM812002]
MSVRIYQLSKEIGLENSELIDLLRERGFEVKSASSTVDNISAESLREEFANKTSASESVSDEAASEPETKEPAAPEPPSAPDLASFVRSPEDIARQKDEAKKAAAAAAAPKPVAPPPPPAAPAPVAPPSPRPAGPPPMAPPSGPAPVAPPSASKPAPAAPNSVSPPATNPGVRPAPSATPPPVPGNKAPQTARPAAPAAPAPKAPPAPPSVGGPPKPPAPAGPGAMSPPSEAKAGEAAAPAGDPDEIKQITLKPPIVVRDFAKEIGVKPFKLISELMEMGIFASVNQSLEEDVASTLAAKHGFLLEIRHRGEGNKAKKKQAAAPVDEKEELEHRPPVVCIMGHVDHGKTSLLDYIRKANVTKSEAGGITQHIGAYQIEHNDHKITFLDTPGHEAFNSMRARGADVTDIAILVVAADDGFKPQTDEALKFIQKSGVQPIVAINKIDTKGANVERVKQQMQERGIASEDWGGQTICVECSAINGTGVEDLLDMVLLQAEVLELQANPKKPSTGIIIEASIEVGRGPTATIIVQAGTLKVGDALVCGAASTKVKAMLDENGKQVKVAPPSTPVRVIGWSSTPDCGDQYETVKNEKVAKSKASENEIEIKADLAAMEDEATAGMTPQEKLFAAIAKTQKKTLRVIVKADAFGSLEAICQALNSIESEKVALEIIGKGVGVISKSDVEKAAAGDAEVIGFNVRSDNGVQAVAKNKAVKTSSFQIIYELVDRVREDMVEMLDPEFRENKIGAAEVRAVFPIAKGFVAGCLVTEGRVSHGANARVLRRSKVLHDSKILTLRRVKDDVKEVRAGTECGIQVDRFNDYKAGDTIEIYEVHEVRAAL